MAAFSAAVCGNPKCLFWGMDVLQEEWNLQKFIRESLSLSHEVQKDSLAFSTPPHRGVWVQLDAILAPD